MKYEVKIASAGQLYSRDEVVANPGVYESASGGTFRYLSFGNSNYVVRLKSGLSDSPKIFEKDSMTSDMDGYRRLPDCPVTFVPTES